MATLDTLKASLSSRGRLPVYPQNHKVGMEVPEGGSNCDKCDYLRGPQKCREVHFIAWAGPDKPSGSDRIPKKTSRYCCDFFEPK